MAQVTTDKTVEPCVPLSYRAKPIEATETEPENVVVFTSYNGTVREVGALPPNLGRATALASEKSISKIWGTSEEEAACHAMRKEK